MGQRRVEKELCQNWPGSVTENWTPKATEAPSIGLSFSSPILTPGMSPEVPPAPNHPGEAEGPAPVQTHIHTLYCPPELGTLREQTPSRFPGPAGNSFVAGAGTSDLPVFQAPEPAQFPAAALLSMLPMSLPTFTIALALWHALREGLAFVQKQGAVGTRTVMHGHHPTSLLTRARTHTHLGYGHSLTHMLLLHTGMCRHACTHRDPTTLRYTALPPGPVCEVSLLGGPVFVEVGLIRKGGG